MTRGLETSMIELKDVHIPWYVLTAIFGGNMFLVERVFTWMATLKRLGIIFKRDRG
jgi:hypothetical protein